MVCLPPNMDEDIEEIKSNGGYVVKRKGGRSLIEKPPKFSPDESLLFVISGRSIQIYDVGTTEFVRTLKDKKDSFLVVGMGFPPNDDRSLITCSEEGSVVSWKWHAAVQSSKVMINLPKKSRVLSFDLLNTDEAVIGWLDEYKVGIGCVDITKGHIISQAAFSNLHSTQSWNLAVGWSGDRRVAAVSDGSTLVHIFDVYDPTKCASHIASNDTGVTSIAWHPTQEMLAVADALGRVFLWRGPLQNTMPTREKMHWHQLPVSSIIFSTQGGLMLSGGAERVMVAWGANNSRRFIPRLPAEILHIAACTSHIAVSTADNGIQIIDSGTMYVKGCIREAGGLGGGIGRGPPLQYIPAADALLLPAGPGHLHLYSTATDSLMYTLDVTNTNIVPPERENLHPEQIEIIKMSIGCRGQWLCTWEGKGSQERIRWWEWETGWNLRAVGARPHNPAMPAGLEVASQTAAAITYDTDNRLRFWAVRDSVIGYEGKAAWCTVAHGVASGGASGGVAISPDGSAVAAWAGPRLTLWDAKEGNQKACLAHPALRPQGRLVQFGRDHHMHYVACTTDSCLAVWNTLSLRLIWIVRLNTMSLITDPFSDRVAAITDDNDVFIFRMSSSQPLVSIKSALSPQRGAITSAAFAPSKTDNNDFRLYMLREQQEIFVIQQSDIGEAAVSNLERVGEGSRPAPSAYSAMMAEKKASMVTAQKQAVRQTIASSKAALNELLLSTPSHAQPSLKAVCSAVLRALSGSGRPSFKVHTKEERTHTLDEDSQNIITANGNIKISKSEPVVSVKKLQRESIDWASVLLGDGET